MTKESVKAIDSIIVKTIIFSGIGAFLISVTLLFLSYLIEKDLLEDKAIKTGYSLLNTFIKQSAESLEKGQRQTFQGVVDNISEINEVKDAMAYARNGQMLYKSGEKTVGLPFVHDHETGEFVNPNLELYEKTRGRFLRHDWNTTDIDESDISLKHVKKHKSKQNKCNSCHFEINEKLEFGKNSKAHLFVNDQAEFIYKIPVEKECVICHTHWKQNEVAGYLKVVLDQSFVNTQLKEVLISNIVIIISVLLLTFFIVVATFRYTVHRPLKALTENISDLTSGEGDLTKKLDESTKNEMGLVGRLFNRFLDKLAGIISKIRDQANSLDNAAEKFDQQSGKIEEKTHEISNNLETIAASSEEITANVVGAANIAEQTASNVKSAVDTITKLSDNVKSIASEAKESSSNMSGVKKNIDYISNDIFTMASSLDETSVALTDVAKNTQKAMDISEKANANVNESLDFMKQLGEAATNIGSIVKLVTNIADQTTVLALNATIEASKAGEVGKGFAVVANSVKALALETLQANSNIEDQSNQMQKLTFKALNSTNNVNDDIKEVAAINELIAVSTKQQSDTVAEITRSIDTIAKASKESATIVKEAENSLKGISNFTDKVAEAAVNSTKEITDAADGVDEIAATSAESAEGVKEVNKNVQKINVVIEEVNKMISLNKENSSQLLKMAGELQNLISTFKI
jgi:methyl-accepting chemotaxis protein